MEVEFDQWLRRLSDTHDALVYTCTYRIGDRRLAEEVSFRVMSAMVGKPQVFGHYGLPYSGRIARLAEPLIDRARRGILLVGPSTQWMDLMKALLTVPTEVRDVIVAGFVLGRRGEALAALLRCDEVAADRRRERAVAWLQTISSGE